MGTPYYQTELARIHHLGFGSHATTCAPGILDLLGAAGDGLVLEVGCGSGRLTSFLTGAGHRVLATDASPAMLVLAAEYAPGAKEFRQLVLPKDPVPEADAIVSTGHVLNYVSDSASVERALVALAEALRPGGVLALDLCDLSYGTARADLTPRISAGEDWFLATEFERPAEDRFVRQMTIFTRYGQGWQRSQERHENVLLRTNEFPALLEAHGVRSELRHSFGAAPLPAGMVALVGEKLA